MGFSDYHVAGFPAKAKFGEKTFGKSMKLDPVITKRFEELICAGTVVLSTRRSVAVIGAPDYVDTRKAEEWVTSCVSFLGRVMGTDSEHYQRIQKHSEQIVQHHYATMALAVLSSAYDDYKGGYLFEAIKRIRAEVFDDFLEQAEHFLKDGYFGVSAVLTGSVLEDKLRKLCAQKSIVVPEPPKLDLMNSELAKAGVYDKLVQKKVTWLADIRNKAAHGKWSEFSEQDVVEMLRATRRFVEEYV
jgi:hypothetical protein